MKKLTNLILAITLVVTFSSIVYADEVYLIGREISPGFELRGLTVGALFVGKFFDEGWNERGRFTLTLAHDGQDIEVCNGVTTLYGFKIVMNYTTGARLVLVGPDSPVPASWAWNDPSCEDGNCPLVDGEDYDHYVTLFSSDPTDLLDCPEGGSAYIAEVPEFDVARQRFGSYGTRYTGGTVSGHLVHTPIICPAIFGSLSLTR